MRIQNRLTVKRGYAWPGLVLLISGGGCDKTDLGKPCGTAAAAVENPIEGEQPVVEVVRIERDSACESFQCLTHKGLTPYCTRTCTLDPPLSKAKSCTEDRACTGGQFATGQQGHCTENRCTCAEDAECKSPTHCVDGECRDDSCPEGYWCKAVQEVGPLAGERYCVFRDVCRSNSDCEAFGVMACQHLGCFDACLRGYSECQASSKAACADNKCYEPCARIASQTYYCPETYLNDSAAKTCADEGCFSACTPLGPDCGFHRLVCEPIAGLQCECLSSGELRSCPEKDLQCQPDSSREPWVPGAVKKRDVCEPESP